MCLKESCFPNCWKVSSVVLIFKKVEERSTAENSALLNKRVIDQLEKCGLFSDFQYGFRSSQSTSDLLTVVSARAINNSWAIRAVAVDIFEAFNRVWHAGLFQKLKSHGISGQIFGLISSFFQ